MPFDRIIPHHHKINNQAHTKTHEPMFKHIARCTFSIKPHFLARMANVRSTTFPGMWKMWKIYMTQSSMLLLLGCCCCCWHIHPPVDSESLLRWNQLQENWAAKVPSTRREPATSCSLSTSLKWVFSSKKKKCVEENCCLIALWFTLRRELCSLLHYMYENL